MEIWYCYIHRKKDNNQIFYVGIGKKAKFKRAYETKRRNKLWRNIVNKYDYVVEITGAYLTKEQAVFLERGVIRTLGRRDKKNGILSNMTSGGDGVQDYVFTEEHKKKLRDANSGENNYWWGKKLSKEHKEKIRISNTQNMVGKDHPRSKLVVDMETGIFYDSVKEASKALYMNYSTLRAMLRGSSPNPNKSSIRYCDS